MTARILVVDDVLPNVKLLEAKLTSEYFDVLTARDGFQALETIASDHPDLVLLDVMMPGMDGFEVCRRVKADPRLTHIPIIMVTALSEPSDRVQGLEAGADDFLTKPVDDLALFARVRSLVRLKMMMDELRLREQTSSTFGVMEGIGTEIEQDTRGARVLAVNDSRVEAENLNRMLSDHYSLTLQADGAEALVLARGGEFDLIVVSLNLAGYDALRLCSQLRSLEETRHVPVLMLVDEGDRRRLAKGLEIGVSDYLVRPIDGNELLARTRTQIRRKRYQDRLRANYYHSMTLAVTDGLTGLYNRRYMIAHLESQLAKAAPEGRPTAVLMMDIDYFKAVNDGHGHGVGDQVLKEFAGRLNRNVRGIDLASRYGGEEFVVVMPDTDLGTAMAVGERLRRSIEGEPFPIGGNVESLRVTCSIGVSVSRPCETADGLLQRADSALYAAKRDGRNRVVPEAA